MNWLSLLAVVLAALLGAALHLLWIAAVVFFAA